MTDTNPLLDFSGLPRFDAILPTHVDSAINGLLAENRALIDRLADDPQPATWNNFAGPLTDGIERLWSRKDAPEAVQDYLAQIRAFNTGGPLLYYPGSPGIAHQLMRPQDKLRLFELHPTDHRVLDATFGAQPGVQVRCADGFVALKSLLPPQDRRAVVLLDPSYELKTDYAALRNTVSDALQRFAVGTYAVWYPVLQRRESHLLPQQLRRIAGQADWLDVRMQVREPDASGFGLLGSGMFLINPPWTLHATLREVLPWLTGVLGQFKGAHFALEQQAG